MRCVAILSLLLILLGTSVPTRASGQSSSCLSEADSRRAYLTMVRGYCRWTDSTAAVAGGDPWAPAALVQQVNDSTVCNSVVAAFNQAATGTAAQGMDGYVFAIGRAGYAFVRPGDTTDGRRTFYIFLQNMSYRGSIVHCCARLRGAQALKLPLHAPMRLHYLREMISTQGSATEWAGIGPGRQGSL